jgi:type I restriction enzyme S subunit
MKQSNTIPQGYKNSPLGIIPEDWEVKKLGEIANISSGGTPLREKKEYWDGDIPWVTTALLNNPIIDFAEEYITKEGFQNSAAKLLPKGTLLMAMYGQGQTRGKVSRLMIEATTNQACASLSISDCLTDYIYYQLDNNYESIRNLSNDGSQKNLSLDLIKGILILLPPLPEQQKIAEILSIWDRAIDAQTQLIASLQTRKRALMQQLLTGKKRLKGFSGKWEMVELGKIFIEIADYNDNKGHTVMTISSKYGLVSQKEKFDKIIAGDSLNKYTLIRDGDFAYNKGNSKLYEMGCIFQLKHIPSALVPFVYICFRAKRDICSEFYKHWFVNHGLDRQLKRIITSGARSDGLLNVNSNDFFLLALPLPPLTEQTAIAEILSAADKEIAFAQEKLAKMKEQKKGLMQVLLTGKRRVEKRNKKENK